jgi:hypothetical protein
MQGEERGRYVHAVILAPKPRESLDKLSAMITWHHKEAGRRRGLIGNCSRCAFHREALCDGGLPQPDVSGMSNEEENNIRYEVLEPKFKKVLPKAYADNFTN